MSGKIEQKLYAPCHKDVVDAWLEWSDTHDDPNELDPANPYNVMDGKWGGFGPGVWFRGRILHSSLPPRNVYEVGQKDINGCVLKFFVRCWDSDLQTWRHLTYKEVEVLPFRTYKAYRTAPDKKNS